jgi:hypothetical protein
MYASKVSQFVVASTDDQTRVVCKRMSIPAPTLGTKPMAATPRHAQTPGPRLRTLAREKASMATAARVAQRAETASWPMKYQGGLLPGECVWNQVRGKVWRDAQEDEATSSTHTM